jgi:hypothetical protein
LKKIPIPSEEVSPLFYLIKLIYQKGFGCEVNENEYNKYFGTIIVDLSYYFYDDEYY